MSSDVGVHVPVAFSGQTDLVGEGVDGESCLSSHMVYILVLLCASALTSLQALKHIKPGAVRLPPAHPLEKRPGNKSVAPGWDQTRKTMLSSLTKEYSHRAC